MSTRVDKPDHWKHDPDYYKNTRKETENNNADNRDADAIVTLCFQNSRQLQWVLKQIRDRPGRTDSRPIPNARSLRLRIPRKTYKKDDIQKNMNGFLRKMRAGKQLRRHGNTRNTTSQNGMTMTTKKTTSDKSIDERVNISLALGRYNRASDRYEEACKDYNEACSGLRNLLKPNERFITMINHRHCMVETDENGNFTVETIDII